MVVPRYGTTYYDQVYEKVQRHSWSHNSSEVMLHVARPLGRVYLLKGGAVYYDGSTGSRKWILLNQGVVTLVRTRTRRHRYIQ